MHLFFCFTMFCLSVGLAFVPPNIFVAPTEPGNVLSVFNAVIWAYFTWKEFQ